MYLQKMQLKKIKILSTKHGIPINHFNIRTQIF